MRTEEKAEEEIPTPFIFLPHCLNWDISSSSSLALGPGVYTISSSGSQAFELDEITTWAFLGLQFYR